MELDASKLDHLKRVVLTAQTLVLVLNVFSGYCNT